MLHIRPVKPEDASEGVLAVYADIKKTFAIEAVPLLFQYIAGFEEYFLYVWDKIKANVVTSYYMEASQEIGRFARKSVLEVYFPSRSMNAFLAKLHTAEKHQLLDTTQQLEELNAKLLVLTIGLREGLKGVVVGRQLLQASTTEGMVEEEIFDEFINSQIMRQNLKDQNTIEATSNMLAPLFGANALMIARYPDFFASVSQEMEELVKTEKYLQKRVELERLGLRKVADLPYSLGCSYQEIAQFAAKKPYFFELLYILSETFPTKFPRLVFTSAVMQRILTQQKGLVVS